MRMRRVTVLSCAALVAASVVVVVVPARATQEIAAPHAALNDLDAQLHAWFEARHEEDLRFKPMQRTSLGDTRHYDEIDDLSEAGLDARLAWRQRSVEELKARFPYASLGPDAQLSYDLWVYELEREQAERRFRRRRYVFTQMQGAHVSLPSFLINLHRVHNVAEMEAYIARISGIGRAMEQLVDRAELQAREGVRPPRFAHDAVMAQARAVITGAPFETGTDSPLYADVRSKLHVLREAGDIDEPKADALRAAAETALRESLKPAYERLIAFMDAEKPRADDVATGVHALPDGRAFYAERLAASTTTEMTAEQIHQLGLSEVTRLHREIEAVKASVRFDGSLQELFRFMREDERFFHPNTDQGREAYLQAARDHLATIGQRLPEYFGLLPKAPLVVRRVEPFREQKGAAQHYRPGTLDGSRPGVYFVHMTDMRDLPTHQLEVIAYHEGNPGHHMQLSIAQELEGVPTFRTQARFTAYSEGWALYAELLAKEMGAYADPYSEIGRLSSELWRAIRLVVDTGLHAKGWTEAQAVEYFLANSPSAEGAIRSEVRRYIVWPGQATAYKVGMQKILALREHARTRLGERFQIKRFHDAVLGGGALPLSLLERQVHAWIDRELHAPALE